MNSISRGDKYSQNQNQNNNDNQKQKLFDDVIGYDDLKTKDIRDLLAIGKLTKSTEDVEFIAKTLEKYKRRCEFN